MTSHLKFCMNSFASCFEDQGLHSRGGICAARDTVETWLRNVTVLILKKVGFERLERQVRRGSGSESQLRLRSSGVSLIFSPLIFLSPRRDVLLVMLCCLRECRSVL